MTRVALNFPPAGRKKDGGTNRLWLKAQRAARGLGPIRPAGRIGLQFDSMWTQSHVMASRVGDNIVWNRQRPNGPSLVCSLTSLFVFSPLSSPVCPAPVA